MSLLDEIEQQLKNLPPEKQSEVLDFVAFLQQRSAANLPQNERSLSQHPAFGSWRDRKIDALRYQRDLRAEWDARS
jgi:hypothetical protein